jgi:hypothetical protein
LLIPVQSHESHWNAIEKDTKGTPNFQLCWDDGLYAVYQGCQFLTNRSCITTQAPACGLYQGAINKGEPEVLIFIYTLSLP